VDGCGWALVVGVLVGAVGLFLVLLHMPEPPDE
jgi:hypothetical protein